MSTKREKPKHWAADSVESVEVFKYDLHICADCGGERVRGDNNSDLDPMVFDGGVDSWYCEACDCVEVREPTDYFFDLKTETT